MNSLNSILIEGNLTRDPEKLEPYTGVTMVRLSIATNRFYKNREARLVKETSFFTVIIWGPMAETCNSYLKKGRGVRVLGRLKQERWETKDQQQRERVLIIASFIEFQNDRDRTKTENDAIEQKANTLVAPPPESEQAVQDPQEVAEAIDAMASEQTRMEDGELAPGEETEVAAF